MKAVIRSAYFDGEEVYQVIEDPYTTEASVEYTTGTLSNAERYCKKYYGDDWSNE